MTRLSKALVVLLLAALALAAFAMPPVRAQETPTITVMTFNMWGIIAAKDRVTRAEAIGRKIALLNPDVVCIDEAFEYRHRDILLKSLRESGYDPATVRYFRDNLYGSGIMLISKFPLQKVVFKPYRVNSTWYDIERLGGKGIAYARLETPWGPLNFFLTHVIARMTKAFDDQGQLIPGDPKQVDRLLQLYEVDRFVRSQRDQFGRAIIAAGDFNVSPEMLEYQFLTSLTAFENSFDVLHPGENPSTFSKDNDWAGEEYSRIDHIFYKNYAGTDGFWVRPIESRVVMNDTFTEPGKAKEVHYSDHYGMLTVFEVVTAEGQVSPSPEGVVRTPCPPGKCTLGGYADGVITMDSANRPQWQNLALSVIKRAYVKKDRKDQLVIPMAEVIAAADPAEPIKVAPESDQELVSRLGSGCGEAAPESQ